MNVEPLEGTPNGATDQILSDHGDLRERLQGLEQHLRQPVDSVGEWLIPRILGALKELAAHFPAGEVMARNELRSLKERVQSALEMVHAHERAETKVTMDAYWDDLGGESR